MTKLQQPIVLTIDDDEQSGVQLRLKGRAEVLARTPDQVTAGDLRKADVVLIDYEIEDWPGREQVSAVALKPGNGVALAAVLRSQLEEMGSRTRRAFAIHSGKLSELAGGLPVSSREHAIARTLNLEWVFAKGSSRGVPLDVQVAALAAAVKSLPAEWPEPERALKTVRRLLATPKASVSWSRRAADDIESCNPPIHAWAVATDGMAFIRWVLHQVLPFPSFLWEERYLAARFHVTVKSLRAALEEPKGRKALHEAQYAGVLAEFLGRRWWRTGIEQLLWKWTDGEPFSAAAVKKAVVRHVSQDLVPLDMNRPVVCVDPDAFRPTDTLVDVSEAVEVKPDDWPAYADQAWLAKSDVQEEAVTALVVPGDRDRSGAVE